MIFFTKYSEYFQFHRRNPLNPPFINKKGGRKPPFHRYNWIGIRTKKYHQENDSIMSLTTILILSIAAVVLFPSTAFVVISLLEGEKRAAQRALVITTIIGIVFLSPILLNENGRIIVLIIDLFILIAGLIGFFLPIGKSDLELNAPEEKVDEREIIFARAKLVPGSDNYQSYYHKHPEHQRPDDEARAQPGLMSPDAKFTEPLSSASTEASFFLTEALREAVDSPLAAERADYSAEEFTNSVKFLANYYGALACGITDLKTHHVYSHIGRGSGVYGSPVELDHQFGIAFTVEMDFEMTSSAPYPPSTMETGRQYVEVARIAVQLAAAIRFLGYPARAHIDGNYRVIAPLVARDAGLGEIGRMGLLMTPKIGPRVRVGVVTTDLPLITDGYHPDTSLTDFCTICKKCANNCPSQSIPTGDREIDNGVLHWKINPETCYHYWTVVGTDCGKCMAVCPYSHPDNWIHNLVRWGNTRSGLFRRTALILDDFFYGKKPASRNHTVLPVSPR
jgi:ferredoxin